jgi:hypothetical protein
MVLSCESIHIVPDLLFIIWTFQFEKMVEHFLMMSLWPLESWSKFWLDDFHVDDVIINGVVRAEGECFRNEPWCKSSIDFQPIYSNIELNSSTCFAHLGAMQFQQLH